MKDIVAKYAAKSGQHVEVNFNDLLQDEDFCQRTAKAVSKVVLKKPKTCVVLPSYKEGVVTDSLGKLINQLALERAIKTLVAGEISKVRRVKNNKGILIIKKCLNEGVELKKQIVELKAMGYSVSVFCLVAESEKNTGRFAKENGVEVTVMVYKTDI